MKQLIEYGTNILKACIPRINNHEKDKCNLNAEIAMV